jgi:hypothetical protein
MGRNVLVVTEADMTTQTPMTVTYRGKTITFATLKELSDWLIWARVRSIAA